MSTQGDEALVKIEKHEALCALQYAQINARLKRLEQILLASAGAIILLLINLVVKLH
jgi:hypothetical protein